MDALLAAVIAAPDDDAPRRVLADWHLAHGDAARGELIQLQCDLAGLDADSDDASVRERARALRGREAELLAAHGERWRGELGVPARVQLARGMPAGLEVQHRVTWERTVAGLAGRPERALLESLLGRDGQEWSPELLAGAAASDALPRLRRLSIYCRPWTEALSRALAASPWSASLTELDVSTGGDRFGPDVVRPLFAGGSLSGLRTLGLTAMRGADAAAALVAVELPALRRLDLGTSYISPEAIAVIAGWLRPAPLGSFRAWPMLGTPAHYLALLGGTLLDGVPELEVPWPLASREVVAALRERHREVRSLVVHVEGGAGDEGMRRLFERRALRGLPAFPSLRHLRVIAATGAALGALTPETAPALRTLLVHHDRREEPNQMVAGLARRLPRLHRIQVNQVVLER